MKKNTKLIVLIMIAISFILYSIYFLQNINRINSSKRIENIYIEKTLSKIMSNELDDYDSKNISIISTKVRHTMENTKDKEIRSKCNFILGYTDFINNKYYDSIKMYNESIGYFNNKTDPEMKARVYYELSKVFIRQNEYIKSEEAFQKSIEICEKEYTQEEIILLNTWRSNDLSQIPDNINNSVKIMEENLRLAKKINYKDLEDVYLDMGIIYWYAKKDIKSINCKLEALEIANSKNLNHKISQISTEIGVDYLLTQNYTKAIKYLEKSLDNNLEDAEIKSYILINLSEAYIKIKDFESANKYLSELEKYINKQKEGSFKEDCITYMYLNKSEIEKNLGNTDKAINLLDLASEKFYNSNDFNFYDFDIMLLEGYGDVYYKSGEYTKALEYHEEAQKLSEKRKLFYYKDIHNEKIYLDYKAIGDYKNAIRYLEKSNELKKESKYSQDEQYTQFLLEKFESEENLEKIAKLQKTKIRMITLVIISVLVIIIIGAISGFIYKKNKETSKQNEVFKNLSETDCLTKVPNRRALEEYLKNNWNRYNKTQIPISFVMIDIDYFKNYNDNYGHVQGDMVLEKVAKCIEKSCRKSDFIARYGGEEFTLIMLNTDKNEAINVIKGVINNIHNLNIKHESSKISDRITLSVGITTTKIGGKKDYRSHIEKSDEALYEAKLKGRNTYVYLE